MKICPNCGARMALDVNFCTKCGTDIRNIQPMGQQNNQNLNTVPTNNTQIPTQPQAPRVNQSNIETPVNNFSSAQTRQDIQTSVNNIKQQVSTKMTQFNENTNFFNWVLASWKSPLKDQPLNSINGFLSFLIQDIFAFIGLAILINSGMSSLLGPLTGVIPGDEMAKGIGVIIILALIVQWLSIVCSLAGHFISFDKVGQRHFVSRLAQLSNINLIIMLAFMLLCMMQASFAAYLFVVGLAVYFIADILAIATPESPVDKVRLDGIYGVIISIILQLLVVFIILGLIGSQV